MLLFSSVRGISCSSADSPFHRVPGFLSSRPNWVPHPLTSYGVLLVPPLGPRGETHSLAVKRVGEPNSDEGTDTLELCVYYKHSSPPFLPTCETARRMPRNTVTTYKDDLSKLLVPLLTHLVSTYSSYKYAVKQLL